MNRIWKSLSIMLYIVAVLGAILALTCSIVEPYGNTSWDDLTTLTMLGFGTFMMCTIFGTICFVVSEEKQLEQRFKRKDFPYLSVYDTDEET